LIATRAKLQSSPVSSLQWTIGFIVASIGAKSIAWTIGPAAADSLAKAFLETAAVIAFSTFVPTSRSSPASTVRVSSASLPAVSRASV